MSTFGRLISLAQVEQAVIHLLATPPTGSAYPLIVFYLAEIERQRGLPARSLEVPPVAESFRGGIDFDTLEEDWLPCLTVVAQPLAERPERTGAGEYGAWFEVQVAATVKADSDTPEADARQLAQHYGTAVAACVEQHGSLGQFADKTVLTEFPKVEWVNPEVRRFCRSITQFETFVEAVLTETGAPPAGATDPYAVPGDYPTVQTTSVTLQTLPLS